jgi:long-chain-fatty-acid--CoA ligase ACSBG
VKRDRNWDAMFVQREGEVQKWTFGEYYDTAMAFAKAVLSMGVTERAGIAMMGFNAPEWAMAFMGGIMANCISTGIYVTNTPDACMY